MNPTRSTRAARAAVAVCAASVVTAMIASATSARAAGLYFSDRGVRPVGRGGAFVAGADDLGAMWYNPAGLAFAGDSLLIDASWLRFGATFQRRSLVHDPASGTDVVQGANYYPEVSGTTPLLPLPTIGISNNLGIKDWNFALGVMAPYAALTSYPQTEVPFNGTTVAAPQRYSLMSLDGSALVVIGAYAAWRPSHEIAIGAGFQMLTGNFASKLAFSACPPQDLLCSAQDPQYDAVTQLTVGPIFAPSGTAGITAIAYSTPDVEVRVAAMGQLPYWISAPAKVDVQLPTAPNFQNASVSGDQATVSFNLPWIARAGIETRFGKHRQTRLELSFVYEAWSMHDSITIAPAGSGITMNNITGLTPSYQVGTLVQPRNFRDTFSIHAGGEHFLRVSGYDLALRGGVSYERSAVPPEYLSVLTVDLDKVQVGIGGSIYLGESKRLRLDATYAHTFAFSQDVDPAAAQLTPVAALRANTPPAADTVKINGGLYSAQADVIGVGMNWKY
ncbi:MAG: OmpP1/FadL family transporter [Polyangiales bacterium]